MFWSLCDKQSSELLQLLLPRDQGRLLLPLFSPVVRRYLEVQLLHEPPHDVVTPAVNFQDSEVVFGRPLINTNGSEPGHRQI